MWKRIDLMGEGDETGAGSAAAGDAGAGAAGDAKAGDAAAAGKDGAGDAAGKGDDKGAGDAKAGEKAGEKSDAKGDTKDKPGFWPENWRETVSKDDAKMLARLQRYASPDEVSKALIAAQDKIRSGELRPVLSKDAKPEEIAQYRKDMGIPETPDKYDLKDVKIDPTEKPFIEALFKSAHATHQTPEMVAANVQAWHDIRAAVMEHQAQSDDKVAKASEDSLREEWGTEFRRNLNLVHSLLDASGDPKLKDNILSGRMADGTPVGSSPAALKLLLGVALKDNPAGIVVPGGSADPAKNVEQRIAEIQKMMRTDRAAYNKPAISGPDGEYPKLLKARAAMAARG